MRLARTLGSDAGFTYTAVMVIVVIMGIMLAQAATVWKTAMQREKETELIFRGLQIRNAMQRFYYGKVVPFGAKPKEDAKKILKSLEDLEKDSTSLETKRYLRPFALTDPMTGKEWLLVKDAGQRIIGVKSSSEAEPIKQKNFPPELEPADFEAKAKYTEWEFIYNRIPAAKGPSGGARGPDGKPLTDLKTSDPFPGAESGTSTPGGPGSVRTPGSMPGGIPGGIPLRRPSDTSE